MVPVMVPPGIVTRKRKSEHQGAQGVDKKTNSVLSPHSPDFEHYFSHACGLQIPNVYGAGTGMANPAPFASTIPTDGCIAQHRVDSFTAFSKVSSGRHPDSAFTSCEEHTDDESECCSSDAGGYVAAYSAGYARGGSPTPISPPLSFSDSQGVVGVIAPGSFGPHNMTGATHHNQPGLMAAYGVGAEYGHVHGVAGPGGGGKGQVRGHRDGRTEVDEWGWFVDAADDELLRTGTPGVSSNYQPWGGNHCRVQE